MCARKWSFAVPCGFCICSDRLRKATNCQLMSRREFEPRKSQVLPRERTCSAWTDGFTVSRKEPEWEVVIWPQSVRNGDLRRGDDSKKSNIFCHIIFEFTSHTYFIII